MSSEFYACRINDVCEAGEEAGDAACVEGHSGPLCDVCWDDWFKFAGTCRRDGDGWRWEGAWRTSRRGLRG